MRLRLRPPPSPETLHELRVFASGGKVARNDDESKTSQGEVVSPGKELRIGKSEGRLQPREEPANNNLSLSPQGLQPSRKNAPPVSQRGYLSALRRHRASASLQLKTGLVRLGLRGQGRGQKGDHSVQHGVRVVTLLQSSEEALVLHLRRNFSSSLQEEDLARNLLRERERETAFCRERERERGCLLGRQDCRRLRGVERKPSLALQRRRRIPPGRGRTSEKSKPTAPSLLALLSALTRASLPKA